MSQSATNAGAKPAQSVWVSWLTIAAVAIILGLLVPKLIPAEGTPEKSEAKAETKDPAKLEYVAPSLPEAPSVQGMLVRLGAGTAIVLGLCVVTLWGIRKWIYPVPINASGPRAMRLSETLHLGGRCSLHLVQMDKQSILIGVDATGIKTIVPLTTAFEDVLGDTETTPVDVPIAGPKLAA